MKSVLSFLDIDECAHDGDDCHSNARCINTEGSYKCTCNKGFTGSGRVCLGKYDMLVSNVQQKIYPIKILYAQEMVVV